MVQKLPEELQKIIDQSGFPETARMARLLDTAAQRLSQGQYAVGRAMIYGLPVKERSLNYFRLARETLGDLTPMQLIAMHLRMAGVWIEAGYLKEYIGDLQAALFEAEQRASPKVAEILKLAHEEAQQEAVRRHRQDQANTRDPN